MDDVFKAVTILAAGVITLTFVAIVVQNGNQVGNILQSAANASSTFAGGFLGGGPRVAAVG